MIVSPYLPEVTGNRRTMDQQLALLFEKEIGFSEINFSRFSNIMFLPVPKDSAVLKRKRVHKIPLEKFKPGQLPPGTVEARIEITPVVDHRSYSVETRDTFHALETIWADLGYPDEPWTVNLTQIATQLGLTDGGKVLKRIREDLETLRRTNTNFVCCFAIVDGKGEHVLTEKDIYVLDVLESTSIMKKDGTVKTGQVTLKFDATIENNILEGGVHPINFKARNKIRSDKGKAFYDLIDRVIAAKIMAGQQPRLERAMLPLIDMWELENPRLAYLSVRRDMAETIRRSIDGIESSMKGITLQASVEKTKDGKDYKVIVTTDGKWIKDTPLLKNQNSAEDAEGYLVEILNAIGHIDNKRSIKTLQRVCRTYNRHLIFKAIGEYRESRSSPTASKVRSNAAYFMRIMEVTVKSAGVQWIKAEAKQKDILELALEDA